MKMVAASRLRKVQNKIIHLRNYAETLKYVLGEVMLRMPPSYQNIYLQPRSNEDVLLITVGSDKGLCGTYNSMLIKRTLKEKAALEDSGESVQLMVLGKKPARFFKTRNFEVIEADSDVINNLVYESASAFAEYVTDLYMKENYGRVLIVYNRFKNAVIHELTVEQVLPLAEEDLFGSLPPDDELPDDYIILEPEAEEVIDYITRQYVHYNFYRIMLDASASEHGSRMTAMHQATDNADDMLKSLTLSYNKARQASVTRELLDIVGGAGRGSN
jgi:F-type H+-transporting ATPase subunit gamma